jgi:hypothetical protein
MQQAAAKDPSHLLGEDQSNPQGPVRRFSLVVVTDAISTESIELFPPLFRLTRPTKQFSQAMKPFSVLAQRCGNSGWLSA